ncbi:protein neuralized isoform X1 [Phlebotomus papatasi]|uniref:protein neuralized isoform X1 n=1 Tax=Phlebotomus papatasi TaxID=29031 RepID=UPI0024833D3E|nr:protein neuralized isoform X1 [Phlebotomus papatasi]
MSSIHIQVKIYRRRNQIVCQRRRTKKKTTRSAVPCPSPNNLPPLTFHQVHGENIRISNERRVARRHESFCKGITFSSRPVRVNERVCVKFNEISNNWSGVIRFGFTYNDPMTLRYGLPKYACPDLTNKPGYWVKALNESYCERDNILFYYVTASGDVHFGINGEEKGVFIPGIETRNPLWTIIDIYGNCTAIEFLDSRNYINHRYQQPRRSIPDAEVERIIPNIQALSVQTGLGSGSDEILPPIRFTPPPNTPLVPLPFHRTKGRNIRLSMDRCIATRMDTEFCQGYVFTARPLRIGEILIVQVLRTESMYVGALALGLTSCDPATLMPTDLPDDSDLLLDRPEYWVVSKDIASTPNRGDEITFCVTVKGEVTISKNGGPATVVMHVDQSLELYAFLDVYGSTQSVRVMSLPPPSPPQPLPTTTAVAVPSAILPQSHPNASPRRLQVQLPGSESMNSISSHGSQVEQRKLMPVACTSASRVINVPSTREMIQLQPRGAVLVVNLPPDVLTSQQMSPRIPSSNLLTTQSNATYIEPYSVSSSNHVNSIAANWQQEGASGPSGAGTECTICYEHPIDSVLYMCGHMCMCYECAVQQWRGIGGGHCPLCRAVIHDVIRTYKS